MPSRKADLLRLASRDTVHRYFLSVAMILCNKMDFSKYLTIQIHSELVRFMVVVFPVLLYILSYLFSCFQQ